MLDATGALHNPIAEHGDFLVVAAGKLRIPLGEHGPDIGGEFVHTIGEDFDFENIRQQL